eukprot:4232977-Lingulodinium_polyedra.AAC.1
MPWFGAFSGHGAAMWLLVAILVLTKGCLTRSLHSALWCYSIGHVQQLWLQTLVSMCVTAPA